VGRGGAPVHRLDWGRPALAQAPARDLHVPPGRLALPRGGLGPRGEGVPRLGGPAHRRKRQGDRIIEPVP